MPILIKNLSFTYQKGTPYEKKALDNINLDIEDGEVVGLVGPIGSGKTTFIQHLNGLLKPDIGSIMIDGQELSSVKKNLKQVRSKVGIVFQYPEHQLFAETVREDIAFGPLNLGASKEELDERMAEVLEIVGLDQSFLSKSPFEISDGEKRRVAIAGVLIMETRILIFDEPGVGLDPKGRNDILSAINKLAKRDRNKIVILVSHNMEDIVKYTQRVIVLSNGKVAGDGKVKEIFRDRNLLRDIGLEVPIMSLLAEKIRGFIPGFSEDVFTVSQAKEEILKAIGKVNNE